jgi:hypothetical protein
MEKDGELMEKGGEDKPVSILWRRGPLTDAAWLGAIPGQEAGEPGPGTAKPDSVIQQV